MWKNIPFGYPIKKRVWGNLGFTHYAKLSPPPPFQSLPSFLEVLWDLTFIPNHQIKVFGFVLIFCKLTFFLKYILLYHLKRPILYRINILRNSYVFLLWFLKSWINHSTKMPKPNWHYFAEVTQKELNSHCFILVFYIHFALLFSIEEKHYIFSKIGELYQKSIQT